MNRTRHRGICEGQGQQSGEHGGGLQHSFKQGQEQDRLLLCQELMAGCRSNSDVYNS